MHPMRMAISSKLRDRAGAAIALVALAMVALLAAVALAVDVGMLVTARTEAQLVGDATALEGARVLRDTNGDSAQAHNEAVAFGSTNNTVRGENVPILNEDVEVIPDEWTVRVRVNRTDARGNPVPTYFARIFGVNAVDITANAAAWAAPATTTGGDPNSACPLPLALLDAFDDANDNGRWDPGEQMDGWDATDHGKLVKIKLHPASQGGGGKGGGKGGGTTPGGGGEGPPVEYNVDYCTHSGPDASWRCWWHHEGEGTGNDVLSPRIHPGTDCGPAISIGDDVVSSPGNRQNLVINEFGSLMGADPDKVWCEDCADDDRGCVVEAGSLSCYDGASIRMRSVPIVDPSSIEDSGSNKHGEIIGFMGVFIEKVSPTYASGSTSAASGVPGLRNVYARLIVEGGSGSTGGGGDSEESLLRNLQLIE